MFRAGVGVAGVALVGRVLFRGVDGVPAWILPSPLSELVVAAPVVLRLLLGLQLARCVAAVGIALQDRVWRHRWRSVREAEEGGEWVSEVRMDSGGGPSRPWMGVATALAVAGLAAAFALGFYAAAAPDLTPGMAAVLTAEAMALGLLLAANVLVKQAFLTDVPLLAAGLGLQAAGMAGALGRTGVVADAVFAAALVFSLAWPLPLAPRGHPSRTVRVAARAMAAPSFVGRVLAGAAGAATVSFLSAPVVAFAISAVMAPVRPWVYFGQSFVAVSAYSLFLFRVGTFPSG